jgi:hypothetical protein
MAMEADAALGLIGVLAAGLAVVPALMGWALGLRSIVDPELVVSIGLRVVITILVAWAVGVFGIPTVLAWAGLPQSGEVLVASAAGAVAIGSLATARGLAGHRRARRLRARIMRALAKRTVEADWPGIRAQLDGRYDAQQVTWVHDAIYALSAANYHERAVELTEWSMRFDAGTPGLAFVRAISLAAQGHAREAREALATVRPHAVSADWRDALILADAIVDVVAGEPDRAITTLGFATRPGVARLRLIVEVHAHAGRGAREDARTLASNLSDAELDAMCESAFPAAAVARELRAAKVPYRS